jgi:hypothetical protein
MLDHSWPIHQAACQSHRNSLKLQILRKIKTVVIFFECHRRCIHDRYVRWGVPGVSPGEGMELLPSIDSALVLGDRRKPLSVGRDAYVSVRGQPRQCTLTPFASFRKSSPRRTVSLGSHQEKSMK